MKPQARVLHRNEAEQMATDSGTVINNVISLAAEASDVDKLLAMDTIVTLRIKQSILEGEIAYSDREQSQGGLS